MKGFFPSCLIVASVGIASLTRSDPASAASFDPDTTRPTVPDVARSATRARRSHCETPSCDAMIVIDKLMSISQYEVGDANGIASLYLGRWPEIADDRLDRILLDHPTPFGPVCMTAAKLVSRVHPDLETIFVRVTLLVNSVDMDLRDQGSCAQTLVTAPNERQGPLRRR